MTKLYVLTDDDRQAEIKSAELAEITEGVKEVLNLVNNPIALTRRAAALLEGTAKRLQLDHLFD